MNAAPARRRPAPARPCARVAAALLLMLCASCAVTVEENRRTLNAMDSAWGPASEGGRWALSPVALPAGLVGLVTDMLVVHPANMVDDAWGDTVELLWTPEDESRFRRAVMLPVVTILTPFVFVGDWIGRSIFVIEPREERLAR